MSLTVQKFGGSCISDIEGIKNAAKIITEEYSAGNSVIAVVSAQGNTTDMLIEKACGVCRKPSKRELDVLMSAGEQIAVSLLSMAVQELGFPCVSLLGWQAQIKTNSVYGSARVKKIDSDRIKKELEKKNIVVIAGFQGVNKNGDMTTLGRGGSDTTAVAVAAALNAGKCQIFSVIDGIYTADPEIIDDAVKIDEISYDAMQELSFLGVKVLNSRAVELAKKYGVPLEVKSAFKNTAGTLVKENVRLEKMLISGVTKTSNIAKITVCGIDNVPGAVFKIFGLLSKEDINTDIILQSLNKDGKVDVSFTVHGDSADDAETILRNSGEYSEKAIISDKNVAKVSVVGAGMESHPGVASAVFEALSDNEINILMISSSEMRLSVVVEREKADEAVKVIHKRFLQH